MYQLFKKIWKSLNRMIVQGEVKNKILGEYKAKLLKLSAT